MTNHLININKNAYACGRTDQSNFCRSLHQKVTIGQSGNKILMVIILFIKFCQDQLAVQDWGPL